jgi:hypothetical protein
VPPAISAHVARVQQTVRERARQHGLHVGFGVGRRATDVTLASLALIMLSPLLLGVALVAAGGGLYRQVAGSLQADVRSLFGGDLEVRHDRALDAPRRHECRSQHERTGLQAHRHPGCGAKTLQPRENSRQNTAHRLRHEQCRTEMEDMEKAIEDIVRGYCCDIYKSLEKEYEYLTSDEAVAEALRANDIDEDVEEEELCDEN